MEQNINPIKELSIDLETYSDIDIKKCGVYKYTESYAFEILLFAVSVNNGPVHVYDLACGEQIPKLILEAITDESIIKWAFNASFERVCLSRYLQRNYPEYFYSYSIPEDTVRDFLDPASWCCSMVWSAYMGLPLSLENVGTVLKLKDQKIKEGKDLIRYFCTPCKPTKANGGRTRNLPQHDGEKWIRFKQYNKRDVEVELAIKQRLSKYPVPDQVWEEYRLDQEINDRGILIDMQLVENAIRFDELSKQSITEAMQELTGLDNPNSVQQLQGWLQEQGIETDSLDKKAIKSLIEDLSTDQTDQTNQTTAANTDTTETTETTAQPTDTPTITQVLRLRQQLARSSVKKYQAMQSAACSDSRARGMFQFYGANRSGRWAGRLIQLQNLPQNHMDDLAEARGLVKEGDYKTMNTLYDDIPDTLAQLIRTSFIPKPGYKYIVSDFSAIEARVLSYLAGEDWRNEVFAHNGDIYCASASEMFGVPVEKHGQNSHLRQKGKIAELALGYGGSVGALKSMGALDMGLQEEELQPLVSAWRNSNPNIVSFWWDIDRAVKTAITQRIPTQVKNIRMRYQSGMLFIRLPSGRNLAYVKPKLGENQFGGQSVTYEGIGATKKWERIESYGPKFVENIVQAISRDILCHAMRTLSHCFIVGHVHDELILECSPGVDPKVVFTQMSRTPPWLPGIILNSDGSEMTFYHKD